MSKMIVSVVLLAAVAVAALGALHGSVLDMEAIHASVGGDLDALQVGLTPADIQGGHVGCKSTTQAIGPCSVKYDVCAKLHHVIHLEYTAQACVSGICGSASGHKSGTGAAYDATYQLFIQRPSCACSASKVPLGNCTFGVAGCFEFASSAAVTAKAVSFFANVSDPQTGLWADYCCASNATDSVKAAFTALGQKESLARCF